MIKVQLLETVKKEKLNYQFLAMDKLAAEHGVTILRTAGAAAAVPSDDLSRGPCIFGAPLGSRSKSFYGLNVTFAARNASGYAVKTFGADSKV
ncbi:hypothetical protein EVAR_29487_1 [Eumeta japonica]|uniref:Uncharacterized protein n=1 Tax=Eumeta variegata TaxID=151549 RepID=A0A4C1WT11_EUMVA|nr:hypothetical protein EVAR_29487_1 [Eumeta japonica]